MTTLLDANVLIALVVADPVNYDAAEEWFAGHQPPPGSAMRLMRCFGGAGPLLVTAANLARTAKQFSRK